MGFSGKVAIVTGGASGIGRAVVGKLAQAGATVVVADFDEDGAEEVADAAGGSAFRLDVSDAAANQALVEFTVQTHGRLDLAVNNAGVPGPQALPHEIDEADYARLIEVNQHSVFYAMKNEIAQMLVNGGGAIVNMSSILGTVGIFNALPYVAAKHAVAGMTKAAAAAYGEQGIRVNSVHPGYVDTPLIQTLPAEIQADMAAKHPMNRLAKDVEVAALVVFLLSDEAGFITGSQHHVDGGYTAV